MGNKRFHFERRVGKIGFLGRGTRLPKRRESEAGHCIDLRIGGDKVSTSAEDLLSARQDFMPMPGLMTRIFSRTPEAVVSPASARDAAEALGVCFEERSSAVPRGAVTSGLGGAVPVKGGVVVDLTRLRSVVDLDRANAVVSVEAGAVWSEVIDILEREGFSPPAYPSSASAATVGGWISTGGYGIGTLRYGNFHEQIRSLEVGLPSGFLVEAAGHEGRYSIPSFAGTEGQIGVITKATFSLRRAPEEKVSFVVRLTNFADGIPIYGNLMGLRDLPFSVELVSSGAACLYEGVGAHPFLLVTQEGTSGEVERLACSLKEAIAGRKLDLDSSMSARELWRKRFSVLRAKRAEEPLYTGSLVAGNDTLVSFISYMVERNARQEDLIFECLGIDRGRTLVTVGCPAGGAEGLSPLRAFARVRAIVAAGARMAGVPYGVGLWNSPYIDVILGDRKGDLRRIKAEVDRLRIMNPGKFFSMSTGSGLPVPGWVLGASLRLAGRS